MHQWAFHQRLSAYRLHTFVLAGFGSGFWKVYFRYPSKAVRRSSSLVAGKVGLLYYLDYITVKYIPYTLIPLF
jgi:hypothetical protein